MVLFATVLGALGALWLSRVASRSLAHPIGSLRGAALAIAGGEREPPLARQPPEEFEPVFSAFRRMAADLGASRAALESAQRRTTAVLRNVATGVVALTTDGTIMLANPRAAALLARPLVPGSPIEDAGATIAAHARAFLSRDVEEEEFEVELGQRRLQARLTRLTAGGVGGGGAVLTVDDVTELLRAQRVLAWGEMARQVAHEIKNPLTPIRLGVQHLKRAYADARGDFDQILDRNVNRILAEIDRLDQIARSFSRYGTAPAERPAAEPVDVAAIARDVVELERLGRGEIEWRLVGGDAPIIALARGDELREVLLNLLENARLADARTIEVRCAQRDGRALIEVCDDGHGIPPGVLPRLFEPHFSTRTSGSGLGLAISRQLIESWGGEIAIASVEGEGTRVRMELRAGEGGL
jgi:nitrogen fixation/metabolism regulation signal transduction histidine kinase